MRIRAMPLSYLCCAVLFFVVGQVAGQQCSGSWKSPDNAYNATWEYDDIRDRVKFTISTANLDRWVGIGFSKDKYMPATDVAYGWVNTDTEARLFDGWISVKAHPRTSEHNDLQMVTFSKKDGRHTLSFWKPRVAREPEDLTLDDVYLMFPAKPGLYNADYSRIFKHLAQPIIGPKVYFGACATSSVGESLQSVARSQTTDVVARRKDPEVVPRKVPDADVVALRATKVASPRRVTDDADVVSRRFLQEATERQLQRAVSEVTDTKQDSQDPFALKLNTPQLIQVQGARTSSTSRQSNERSSSSSQRSATGHDACSGSWIADDGSYTATWDYVPATDRVRFSVSVNTLTGWIGLGFSNNRFMPFTDLAYGWINEQNEAKLIDGWLYTYSVPRSGEQQDLELISASRSGNRQTIEFTKPRLGGQDDLDLAGVYLVFPTKPGPYDASSESVSKHHEPPVIGPKVDFTSCVQTQVARASNTRASARALGTRAGGSTYTSRRDNILLSKSGGSQHSSRDSIFRESLPFETPPTRATRRPPIRATPRPTTRATPRPTTGGSSYRESLPFETPPTPRATPRPTTRATPRPTTRGSTYRESLPVETPSTRPTPRPIAPPVDFGSRPVTGVAQRIGSTRRSHQRISRRPLPATRRRPRTRTPRPTDPTTVYTTDATTTEIPTEPTTEVTTAPPTRRPFRRRQSLVAHQQRLQRISAGRRRPRPVPTRTGRPQPPPTTTTTTRPTTTTEAPVVRPTTPAFEPPGPRNFAASCEGYWSYPEACPASQCDYAIHWIYEALQDRVKFTITVPQGKWVSVGFSKNGRMKDTDIAFGWVTPDGLARLFDGFLTGYRPPVVAESNDLQFDEARLANGVQTLIFWKPRTGLINDLTLNGVHLVFPHKPGTYDTSKPELPTISKHEQTPVVGPKVNFRTCRLDLSRIQSQPRVRAPATRPTPIVRQALDRSGKDSEPLNSRLTPTRSQQQRTGSAATTSQQRLEQSTVARGTGQQQSGQTTLTQVGGQQRFGQTTSGSGTQQRFGQSTSESGTDQQRFGQSTTARRTGQQQSGQTTLTQAGGQQRFGQSTSGSGTQQRFGQSTTARETGQQQSGQTTLTQAGGQQRFGQTTSGSGTQQRFGQSTSGSGTGQQRFGQSTTARGTGQQQSGQTTLTQVGGQQRFGQSTTARGTGQQQSGQTTLTQAGGQQRFGQSTTARGTGQQQSGQTTLTQVEGQQRFGQSTSGSGTGQQRFGQSATARGTGQQQSGQTTLTQAGGQQRFGQTTSGSGTGQQRFGQSTTARGTGQQQSGQTTLTQVGGQQRFGQTTSGSGTQQRFGQSTTARGTGQQQSGQTTLTQVGGQQRFGQTTSGSGTGQQRFGQSTTARGTGQQQSGQRILTQAGGQQRFGQTTSGRGIGQQRFGQSTSIGGIDQQRFGQSTASRTGQQQFGQNTNGRGIAQRQSFSTQTSGQRLVPSTSAQVRSQQQFSSTQLASRPQSGQRQGSLSITSSSSRPLPSFSTLARPAPNRGLSLGQRQSILNTNRATNNVPRATTPRPGSTTKGSLLFLGELRNFSPSGIRGKIYGIDRKQIGLSGFVFDPFRESCRDPVFYIGVHDHRSELLANQKSGAIQQCPGEFGIQVPDENKSLQPLRRRYNGQNIVLLLPDGVETIQLQWLSLWCRSTNTDLASAVFPGEALRPVPPEGVTSLQGDGVSSTELATLNASTVGIAGLRYNRKYESTFFVVGKSGGETPTKENIVSIVPDENGELDTNGIGPYNGDKIVILDLPAGLTWLDVDYFAIFTYKQCNPKPLVWLRIKVEE